MIFKPTANIELYSLWYLSLLDLWSNEYFNSDLEMNLWNKVSVIKMIYYRVYVRTNIFKSIKRGLGVNLIDALLFTFFTIKALIRLIQITATFNQIFDFAFIFTCERFKKADVRVIAAKWHPYVSYSIQHLLFQIWPNVMWIIGFLYR